MGREWIRLQKGRIRDSDGDENVLYLVCISIVSLIILFYSFSRCCCWEKLGKRYVGFLYYVIWLHGNLSFSYNEKFSNNFFKILKKLISLNTMSMILSNSIQLWFGCHMPSLWRWSWCPLRRMPGTSLSSTFLLSNEVKSTYFEYRYHESTQDSDRAGNELAGVLS